MSIENNLKATRFSRVGRFPGTLRRVDVWSEDGCRQMGLRAYLLSRWRGFLYLRRKQRCGAWRGFDNVVDCNYYGVYEADYCVLEVFSRHYGQDVYARN